MLGRPGVHPICAKVGQNMLHSTRHFDAAGSPRIKQNLVVGDLSGQHCDSMPYSGCALLSLLCPGHAATYTQQNTTCEQSSLQKIVCIAEQLGSDPGLPAHSADILMLADAQFPVLYDLMLIGLACRQVHQGRMPNTQPMRGLTCSRGMLGGEARVLLEGHAGQGLPCGPRILLGGPDQGFCRHIKGWHSHGLQLIHQAPEGRPAEAGTDSNRVCLWHVRAPCAVACSGSHAGGCQDQHCHEKCEQSWGSPEVHARQHTGPDPAEMLWLVVIVHR